MSTRVSAKDWARLATTLTASEVRGLLSGRFRVVENFETFLEFPTKPCVLDGKTILATIRTGWKIDATTTYGIESLTGREIPVQKLVLIKPKMIGLPFGSSYEALIKAARVYSLQPLPEGIAPLLQGRLLLPNQAWTQHKKILCITNLIPLGGTTLLFTVGKAGLVVQSHTATDRILGETLILLGKM